MRSRSKSLVSALCLLIFAAAIVPRTAEAQMHAAPTSAAAVASQAKSSPRPADAAIETGLSLNLCVDGSANYPCPDPILSDDHYVPAIQLTYGQVLDGVVLYSPASLNFGTITLYKDGGAGPEPICVLHIGADRACPPGSTVFDVGDYTLTATLGFALLLQSDNVAVSAKRFCHHNAS